MTTTLHELPPLHVTTVGIPPDEHITEREAHQRERALWWGSDRIAWLASWLLLVLLAFFFIAMALPPRTTSATGTADWTAQRAGERASVAAATTYDVHLVSPFTGEAYPGLPDL